MVRLAMPFASLVVVTLTVASPQRPVGEGGDSNCPDECPDSVKPVCGSNGVLYRNDCSLARVACRDPTLTKRNDGPCFATSLPSGSRPGGSSVAGGSTPSESSKCREECTKIYMPVCGTDGRTYNNKCILEAESCKIRNAGGRTIGIAAEGVCTPRTSGVQSSTSGSGQVPPTPSVPAVGVPAVGVPAVGVPAVGVPAVGVPAVVVPAVGVPACPDTCSPGFRPVCGSDGLVYGTDCKLNLARCRNNNPSLVKKNDGVCTKDCSMECYEDDEPVCGSNKVTYINDCFLALARCRDRSISKVSNGACNTTVRPVCELQCDEVYNPVCGSDGGTYNNNCQLQASSCIYRGLLKLYDGRCKPS